MIKMVLRILVLSTGMAAISALAHTGAQGVVKARMDAMSKIGENMKTLGQMATGKTEFDPDRAQTAAQTIEKHARNIAALFQEKDMSAPSESRQEIWTDWNDFVSQAEELVTTARRSAQNASTLSGVRAAVPQLGATCKSCHQDYRL
jgi:cytochrome c556